MKKSKKRGNPLLRWRFVYTVTKARIYRQKCKLFKKSAGENGKTKRFRFRFRKGKEVRMDFAQF